MSASSSYRYRATIVLAISLTVGAACSCGETFSAAKGRIDSLETDKKTLTLTVCESTCSGKQLSLQIPPEKASVFEVLRLGDRVSFTSDEKSVLQGLVVTGRFVSRKNRAVVFTCGLILCLLIATAFSRWRPWKFILGEDKRYSNSKFQMATWFCILITTYLGFVVLRVVELGWNFLGGVNIPTNLLLLSGMSALTFAGAKGITTAKIDTAITQGNPTPKPSGKPDFFKDLVQSDVGTFDLGDFQMLVVTFLATGMYVVTVFHALEVIQFSQTTLLPNVDTTILASFGLGQGAYLTKKAVGNAGTS